MGATLTNCYERKAEEDKKEATAKLEDNIKYKNKKYKK